MMTAALMGRTDAGGPGIRWIRRLVWTSIWDPSRSNRRAETPHSEGAPPDNPYRVKAARLIVKRLPAVKARTRTLASLAGVPFESMSFFLLSDVLLDNWQIANIERLFVKAERTLRTGGRYYYTILTRLSEILDFCGG